MGVDALGAHGVEVIHRLHRSPRTWRRHHDHSFASGRSRCGRGSSGHGCDGCRIHFVDHVVETVLEEPSNRHIKLRSAWKGAGMRGGSGKGIPCMYATNSTASTTCCMRLISACAASSCLVMDASSALCVLSVAASLASNAAARSPALVDGVHPQRRARGQPCTGLRCGAARGRHAQQAARLLKRHRDADVHCLRAGVAVGAERARGWRGDAARALAGAGRRPRHPRTMLVPSKL